MERRVLPPLENPWNDPGKATQHQGNEIFGLSFHFGGSLGSPFGWRGHGRRVNIGEEPPGTWRSCLGARWVWGMEGAAGKWVGNGIKKVESKKKKKQN